ncbi:MAG: hypothetical protein JXR94_17800, partial [Candidatus Hydrogenedentes bacterium]|nr:hypothetical protein [Candidatus Hydrogenedentota bacterium]
RLYLTPPLEDLDKAFALLPEEPDFGDLREKDRALFWREQDRVAVDPYGDLLRTYCTGEARCGWEFDTDETRDLLALWARWGAERLYLRIDYASPRDLTGLTFQDTAILLDLDSTDEGHKAITPLVDWDRGADWQAILHHWFDAEDKSQYDVEIIDKDGECASAFRASGFANAQYPLFALHGAGDWCGAPGTLMVSLARAPLGLKGEGKVAVQVCTFKGGIESHRGLERPREQPGDEGAFWDVADTFGEENVPERVAEKGDTRPVLIGSAAVLTVPAG